MERKWKVYIRSLWVDMTVPPMRNELYEGRVVGPKQDARSGTDRCDSHSALVAWHAPVLPSYAGPVQETDSDFGSDSGVDRSPAQTLEYEPTPVPDTARMVLIPTT
jgi:hypothetical protein